MSFNPAPKWTENITLPQASKLVCPVCGQIAFNAEQVLEELQSVSYYNARHVPPAIYPCCGNPECEHCDDSWIVELSAVVVAATTGEWLHFNQASMKLATPERVDRDVVYHNYAAARERQAMQDFIDGALADLRLDNSGEV